MVGIVGFFPTLDRDVTSANVGHSPTDSMKWLYQLTT